MRVPSAPVAQPLTYMWERHREIARRLVAGDRQCDIAASLGITQTRLSIICNSPVFKQYISELSEKADLSATGVHQRIVRCSPKALDILEEVLNLRPTPDNDKLIRIQTQVAQDVLDRAGHSAVKKVESISTVLTGDDIARLKERKAKLVGSSSIS